MEALYTPPLTIMSLITLKERHIREPIWYLDSGFSRSMIGVKSYLHKYVEKPGPKVVFGDNSSCITEGYGSINCGFEDKQGIIFNANKEIVLIAPRRNDVYVLDMSSLTPNGACFFAKASEISPMSINHEKYTLVIVDEYSRMVKNQNDVKVKQIRTDNGTEFRNHELESFCDEKGISQNFSSSYTSEQNGVAKRKNRTLIEAARTMLNGSVLSKHFWTDAERIPHISYFYVFGCPVFIHNHKDHLAKFDAKADDRYFLGYSSVSKAFRVYNTRRQQIEETYRVTFDENMKAIRFTNNSVDEIGIDDSSRYPPDEFQEDDLYRQYQVDSNVLYYIIPHGRSLTEITQENHVPEVIAPNEPEISHIEDTKGIHEQNVQNDQMITQPTNAPSGNNTEEPKKVFRNKKDKHGTTIKNKVRLVAQGYSQEEGIDYDETFTPVARMEAIKIFLALATYMNFKVYQIDVKSAFQNDKLKEEVYVKQPPGFENSEFPDYICKLDKALYD
ncbi:retrovirus-related pol polyprotein from transposon TNT 1-94 [Tanacetum coccineum]